jgi:alpha-ketoglutarate-dependent taurine dioxygenase
MEMHLIDPTGFDNSPDEHVHIEVAPLAAAMGAEVRGVQAAELDDAAFEEVHRALLRHKMIYFRDQRLTHADHERFTLRLGEFGDDAYTTGLPGHEHVQPVTKEAGVVVPMIFGTGWHTDSAFLERPPAISTLYAVEVPPWGGDTIWANTALAFRMLSPTMQAMLEGLRVRMSRQDVVATQAKAGAPVPTITRELADDELALHLAGCDHPLVRTHPDTGERALYVDEAYTTGIEGLTDAEAAPLLHFLVEHITRSAFTCRLRWSAGTFALWDNRTTLHQAYNDHVEYRREMYRTTVRGDAPV